MLIRTRNHLVVLDVGFLLSELRAKITLLLLRLLFRIKIRLIDLNIMRPRYSFILKSQVYIHSYR